MYWNQNKPISELLLYKTNQQLLANQNEEWAVEHCDVIKRHTFVHQFKWVETAKTSWKAWNWLSMKQLNSLMKLIWHNRSWSNNVSLVWVTASKQPYKMQWKGLDEVQRSQEWSITPACSWQEWQTLPAFIAAGWSSHLTLLAGKSHNSCFHKPRSIFTR